MLEKRGIRPERLQLEWVSAAEGGKFQKVMNAMEKIRSTVTTEEITQTMEILSKEKRLQKVFAVDQAINLANHSDT